MTQGTQAMTDLWLLIKSQLGFLQGHRKLKLPPCGEFQSRMNLVMIRNFSKGFDQPAHVSRWGMILLVRPKG